MWRTPRQKWIIQAPLSAEFKAKVLFKPFLGDNGRTKDSCWQPMGTVFINCIVLSVAQTQQFAILDGWFCRAALDNSRRDGGMQLFLLLTHSGDLRLVSDLKREKLNPKAHHRCRTSQANSGGWTWKDSRHPEGPGPTNEVLLQRLHPKAHLSTFPQVYKLSLRFQVRSHNWFVNWMHQEIQLINQLEI